jgi:hypothetical protein
MHLVKLLLAAPLLGCVTETTHPTTTVTAQWTLGELATGRAIACPAGVPIARLVAQPVDGGDPVQTDFACSDGLGVSAALAPAPYAFVVQLLAANGVVYAQSTPRTIDLTDGNDELLAVTILDDAGYAQVAWTLADATSGAPLTCVSAMIDHVVVTATGAAGAFADVFPCDAHAGLTHALPTGAYAISVTAERANQRIGIAASLSNQQIEAKNRVTDVGSVQVLVTIP